MVVTLLVCNSDLTNIPVMLLLSASVYCHLVSRVCMCYITVTSDPLRQQNFTPQVFALGTNIPIFSYCKV